MPQPPRNDGWKHTSKQNPAKPPAAQHTPNTSRKPWQPGVPKAKTTAKTTSRWTKFLVAGVIVGLLTAGVVVVVRMILQPKYASVVVVAPDVPDSLALPENAAGVASTKGVEEVADNNARIHLSAGRDATAERDAWRSKVVANEKGLVLYFAAHAGADTKGPYLWLPPKGAAVSDADKLYVTEILQRLSELPKSHSKLLVIDIAQTPANWVFGGAYSDFVRAVKGLDSKIEEVGELAVLLSADEDQVSWIADERRKSTFGFYFVEGIRGAAGKPGDPLNANDLHTYLKTEVQKWAVANRGANQQPVLLPKSSGEARAKKLDLAILPQTPYTPPDKAAAQPTPPELRKEWERVEKLASLTPSPDTTDPLKWREYLEWLLRWERLLRVEGAAVKAVPDTLPPRVKRLGDELEARAADAAVCGVVALPAGPALSGIGEEKQPDTTFAKLWEPPDGSDHGTEWGKLVKDADATRETAIRTAVARFVVDKVLADNVSKASLDTADKVLRAVGGVQPVEAHYVRMLHLHLPGDPKKRTDADQKQWPPADLLRTAITLRRMAEQTAWADGLSYPEQAFRWTFPLVDAADKNRQKGEDLLFDTDPKSWNEAAKLFAQAQQDYATAKDRAQVVAEALARRDRVFARLPYYGRWVAAAHDGPKNPDELLDQLEQAAGAAHKIDKLIREVSANPTDTDVTALKKASTDAAVLDAVADAYDKAAKLLSGEVQASNWHALDVAQLVPFRKLEPGPDLGQKARTVAASLATAAQQPAGTTVPDDSAEVVKSAARHLRAAAAHLNDPTLARNTGLGEKPVKLAEDLATSLRGLPVEVSKAAGNADAQDTLRGGSAGFAEANRLARLSDPAAPVGGTPTPPEADRRFWRHYLLLAQARRFTLDGWCGDNPAEKNTDRWYCVSAAKLVQESADTELTRLAPGRANLPPARQERLAFDLAEESKRRPTELDMQAEPTRVVVPDEPNLRYAYSAAVKQGERVGFPVAQYDLPEVLAKANPQGTGRRLERRLSTEKVGELVPQVATFAFGADRINAAVNTLSATLRYRGRLYQADTGVTFAGKPNFQLLNNPPSGNAVAALQAKPEAVAGAVTILIDVTLSMTEKAFDSEGSRALQARIGLQKLVEKMLPGTQVTIGRFYGKGQREQCEVIRKPFVVRERVRQGKELFEELEKSAAPVDGSYTSLAGAIRTVLDPTTGKDFWPAGFTGQRVLVVLTDGADTWNDDGNPGYTVGGKQLEDGDQWQVVQAGLKAAVADRKSFGVAVHMVMFGLDPDAKDAKRAKRQFGGLPETVEKAPDLSEARFHFLPGVKNGDEFATKLAQAVMPRVRYSSPEEKTKVMVASLAGEPEYNPTPELAPGTFTLTDGVNELPRVQLGAGERALLRAERNGNRVDITRPPFASELAERVKCPSATGGRLAITMPKLKYEPNTPRSSIEAMVTLEELDPALKDGLLKAGNRDYAWFDLANPDGTPFDPAKGPRVTIRNHLEGTGSAKDPRTGHELLAPAWDVAVEEWDEPGKDPGTFRRPRITGYWLNGLPAEKAAQNVEIDAIRKASADALPLKAFQFGTGKVEVRGVEVVERNKQLYLTVWMDYEKPGELVLLRATGWKGGRVGESHTYYDRHHRYTAEFGPFPVEELNTGLRLWLYSVDDLRKFATDNNRVVTLEGEKATTKLFDLSRQLVMIPQK